MTFHRIAAAVVALGAASAAHADPSTVVSGKIFTDYTYRQNVDDATGVSADKNTGTALDVKRFYLGVDHNFDDVWRARIRTDIYNLVNGKADIFVKHAFLEGKFAPELDLKAGSADLPWVPFVEDLYGFRYVENVLIDRTKFGTSADWGLHAGGKLGGVVDYAVSVVNGRGYGDPTRTRAPAVEGRLSTTVAKGLTVAVGGQAGKLGQNVVGVATPRTAERVDALVAWVGGGARVGGEFFWAHDYSAAIVKSDTLPQEHSRGGSIWASYEIVPKVTLFARGDYVQPAADTNSSLKDMYFDAGVQYSPVKPVQVALVYKHDQVKDGTLSTANGTIGSATAGKTGTFQEVGAFAQMSF